MTHGPGAPGLAALLSRAVVAFTIECDNAYEARIPLRTTRHATAGSGGPWLTSMAMWWTCMRFVDERGINVGELLRLARTPTNFDGMVRWGYVTIAPDPNDARAKPPKRDWLVRATANGLRARAVWGPLPSEVEQRWRERFGAAAIDELRDALRVLIGQFDVALPDCLPILGHGLFNLREDAKLPARAPASEPDDLNLPFPASLAKALLAFALHYERRSPIALAVAANVLRVIARKGTHVADLPRLGGVSREAVAMALNVLQKEGYATVGRAPAERRRTVSLSERGDAAQHAHQDLLAEVEARWRERFGADTLERLRSALCAVAGGDAPPAALLEGVRPPPGGWRAAQPPIERFPEFPMVLHRGGFPDGA